MGQTTELFEVRGTFPTLSTRRGKGACWSSGMGLGRVTSFSITHSNMHPTNHKLVSSLSGTPLVLGWVMGDFGLTRLTTAWTWGKPPPSPINYTLQLSTGATSKWLFVPGLPSGSPEIPTTGILATLKAYNFLCKPPIAMRSKAKLYPLSRTFQRYVACCLHARKLGRFLTFNDRDSNCQFDS